MEYKSNWIWIREDFFLSWDGMAIHAWQALLDDGCNGLHGIEWMEWMKTRAIDRNAESWAV